MSKLIFINRFFHPDFSATSQMLSDLVFELADGDVDVHVVTSRLLYDDRQARLPAEQNINGAQVHRVLTSSLGRARNRHQIFDYLTFLVTGLWMLIRVASRGDTVVVKTDPPLLSVPVVVLSRLFGWRQINWLQDAFPEIAQAAGVGRNKWPARALFSALTWLRNLSLQHSAMTVVLGEKMLEHIAHEKVRVDRLTVIPNWSDTQAVQPVARADNALRAEWGLQEKFVLGYSGNMGIAHDFSVLLEAAAALQDDPSIQILFIGNGKRKVHVQRQAEAMGLTNVLFKPYQQRSALANSLSVIDLHLVTLRPEMEGLIVPSKLYGVAAAGRPTLFLGDSDGEVARLVSQYDCGVTVSSDDPAAIAAAVRNYAQNPLLLARHGKNARAMAVGHFDLKISVAKWRALVRGDQPLS